MDMSKQGIIILMLFMGGFVSAKSVEGVIEVASGLSKGVTTADTLFVIVRRWNQNAGPPLAVKKVRTPRFPYKFAIGAGDMMRQGLKFDGPFTIEARISKSGGAIRRKGDLIGRTGRAEAIRPGATRVKVTIDEVVR
jgi:hypothetical protein